MKLLIVSQYFWPESFIINDVVRTLGEQGHEVTVATGKPNYPDGKVFEGYRAWSTQRERYLGLVEVVRVPLWPRGQGGAKNLILNYVSFVLAGLLFLPWMLRKREFDAILVFAPSPVTQVIPAILLKWMKRAELLLWVQDLWPESLAATGFVKSPWVLKAVGWMVKALYRCCDMLLVQSRAFITPVARYADPQKIMYYPNSLDVRPHDTDISIQHELRDLLDKHFCVVFAGNLGTAQSLETLVQAAILLSDDPQIRLVLVGSGSRLGWLRAQQEAHELNNLILPGRFPMEVMPQIFERSSALLVSLSNEEIFTQTIPSKIQAYLAAGKPILASLDGEGAVIIGAAKAGLVSPAGDHVALARNIQKLKNMDKSERELMGRTGRVYFEKNFDMPTQVKYLIEIINGLGSR